MFFKLKLHVIACPTFLLYTSLIYSHTTHGNLNNRCLPPLNPVTYQTPFAITDIICHFNFVNPLLISSLLYKLLPGSCVSLTGIIKGEAWFSDKPALCELVASVCLTSCFCSLLSIGAISFNRYIHICQSHLYQRIFTKKSVIIMCVALWVRVYILSQMITKFCEI